MKQLIVLSICLFVLILVPEFVRSEILASSGSPMARGNPNRNNQINKKLLCPSVAPGRTQVWNVEWKAQLPANFSAAFINDAALTQDDKGFVYLQCSINGDTKSKILKFNGTDGSYDINLTYSAPFAASRAVPTHVQGNKMYIAAVDMTTIVNTTSMTDIAVLPHASYDPSSNILGSYAPLNKDFMVTSYPALTGIDILRYLNASSAQFDSTQPNVVGAFANNVIIYTNASGANIPIVVLSSRTTPVPITIWSPNYQITLPGTKYFYDDSYVQNNQLVVQYLIASPQYAFIMAIFDPETGELIQNISRNTFNSQSAYFNNVKKFGNKAFGYGSFDSTNNIIDFWNERVILEDRQLLFTPLYSVPDNSVLLAAYGSDGYLSPILEFISLDWDTEVINAVGSFPTDAYFGDVQLSPPIIGDDCMLYQYLDDAHNYPTTMFAFKPLPVSDIVPILECINADGVGYFSYNNMEDKRIVIPYAHDRNNLKPMDVAPAKDFRAHRRGKYFPMSSRVTLDNSTFTWQLEDYVLSFTNTPQLRCPQNVTIILYFNATNAVPSGFDEWTRQTFVTLSGISDSRVTVVTNSTQGSVPADIAVELQVTTGNSSQERTPEQAAQYFASISQFYNLKNLLANDPTYSSSNIAFIDIDGAGPLATELYGTIPSPQPLTQTPISQPDQPTSQPQSNNQSPSTNAPKTTVSTSSLLSLPSAVVTTLVLLGNL